MEIYNNLPIELKDKVDVHIVQNVKEYTKKYLLPEIIEYRRKLLINQIYNHYQDFKKKHNFFVTYNLIEEDILYWLNIPHSNNMDSPLMSNRTSKRFKRVLRRTFPYAPCNINEQGYNVLTKHLTKHQIVNIYFKKLNVIELESFYRYRIRQLIMGQSKYVNKLPII